MADDDNIIPLVPRERGQSSAVSPTADNRSSKQILLDAIARAQAVLGDYCEPGGRKADDALTMLLAILTNDAVDLALAAEKDRPEDMPMRLEMYDDSGEKVEEVLGRLDNPIEAIAAYDAAVARRRGHKIMLSERARIMRRNWRD